MVRTWIIAGVLNLFTAFVHLIAGHFEMVIPLLNSTMDIIPLATLYACWHMVSITLFFSSIVLLYIGIKPTKFASSHIATIIGILYILYSLLFLVLNIEYGVSNLPQWILLLPIGLLSLYGVKKYQSKFQG